MQISTRDSKESYDLHVDGEPFSYAYEALKSKLSFRWENKDRKHDPYEEKQFGSNLDKAVFSESSRDTEKLKMPSTVWKNDTQPDQAALS